MGMELYKLGVSAAALVARQAERAEAAGWHGLAVVDSQNQAGDAWVALTIAASHTSKLGLATGVTNPVTRPWPMPSVIEPPSPRSSPSLIQ
jgi:alkanesulfonate monooxygenase SsuD/methylene tetrahydromethanopterin reductase-like flavin-dependent oxidoreductase (luciferase family)